MNTLRELLYWYIMTCLASQMVAASEVFHQCKGIRNKRHAQISMPPNIGGSWFSPRCELLPGPQYLLRQYEFTASNEFTITRYYYTDEFCGEVSYAIQARGILTPQSKSWYLNEATDMDIELTQVLIKPYTAKMSMVLKSQVFRADCVYDVSPSTWSAAPYESVRINSTSSECLQSLSFSPNELLVMRQVDYYSKGATTNSSRSPRLSALVERELQLGDGVWYSLVDRPSSYQPPLYSVTHKHCEACQCIYRADIDHPPTRCHGSHEPAIIPYNITGHWFSQTCESVQYSLFTLRSYKFNSSDSTFNITTYYFTDAFCTQQSFVLRAEGSLVAGRAHSRIYNTKSYQLTFKSVYVGVLSDFMQQLVSLGDSSKCGHVTQWDIGEMYDVTSTGGCNALGVSVRDSEFVLIKVEQHHTLSKFILLSEMKANPQRFEDQVTHFTPKLKSCDNEPVRWVKTNAAGSNTRLSHTNGSISSEKATPHMCAFAILIGVFYTMTV